MTGRKYHYLPMQIIAHRLPHRFLELLFIARLRIIFRNNIESRLVRLSAVLVRSVIRGTSWRSASSRFGREPFDIVSNPFALNHKGLHKGKYLKYWYSIFKEQKRKILPLIYFLTQKQNHNPFFKNFLIFFKLFSTEFCIAW